MTYKIKSTDRLEGTIILPSSKSISNRILTINALCYNTFEPENISDCDDTRVMLNVFDSDGANFDIGAAGTAMRFLTAFLSKTFGEWTITGTERMKNRPIRLLVDAIEQLGGKIEYMEKEGYPPLRIFGSALNGGKLKLDGGVSSQYISALMMIAPYMRNGLTLELTGKVISKPYIRLTAQLMMAYGAKVVMKENRVSVLPGEYSPIPYFVESDWSAASYWYQMVALADDARIELPHLLKHSLQGDSYVAELFDKLGVHTTYNKEGVVLTKKPVRTRKMIHNFIDQPDLTQTFVVTCCLLNIPFYFSGLESLKIKETDRIEALKNEMHKLGYVITDKKEAVLEWNGERCNPSDEPIHTYEDHRMAMAFAPAALRLSNIEINDPQVVTKSYPHYWDDLQKAGLKIENK